MHISKEVVALNGIDKIKIHGLKIGRLAIKTSVLNSKKPGLISTLWSFTDKEFSDWLPIWAWIIEHPEGIFLIDTGLSSDVNQKGYFKELDIISRYYFEKQMKFQIKRKEEIDEQLKKIGIKASSISKIILTHLHLDHTGGLKYFPNTPVLVNKKEWKTKDGAFPQLFPPNMNIQTVNLVHQHELFGACHFLTQSKDLIMIHTPGHTRGHVSIALIANDKKLYLFGGDVAYTKMRLINKSFSATIKNHKANIESCEKILEFTKKLNLIFLPSHDKNNGERLKNDSPI